MSIEIVAVDITEMKRTALMTRARSPQVRALYQAMFSMKPGQALAVVADPDEQLSQIRNLVALCASRAEIPLQIVVDRVGNRVLFTHEPNSDAGRQSSESGSSSKIPSRTQDEVIAMQERRDKIREAALELGQMRPQISAQEVVDYMRDNGNELDVPRPTMSASAVMRNMPEFQHVDRSRFSLVG